MQKNTFFIFILSLALFCTWTVVSHADMMNPDYLRKKCGFGEKEVTCSYARSMAFGPVLYDGCEKYNHDASYQFLVGHGSSFGGESKYCKRAKFDRLLLKNFFIALLITLLLETLIAYLFLTVSKKPVAILKLVVLANIISLPVVWFIFPLLAADIGYLTVISEFFAVIFETCFIYGFAKKALSFKYIFFLSLCMNATSFYIGRYLFDFLQSGAT